MPFPSPAARVFAAGVCSARDLLSLPMAFDCDLNKFVAWNWRFLESLSFDSILPGILNEEQISLELRRLEKGSPVRRAAGTLAIGWASIYRFVFATQLRLKAVANIAPEPLREGKRSTFGMSSSFES